MVWAQPGIRLENETHKVLWDFEIQTDRLISARRPDLVIANEKKNDNILNSGLCRPGRLESEIKRKREEINIKRTIENKGDDDTNCNLVHLEQAPKDR